MTYAALLLLHATKAPARKQADQTTRAERAGRRHAVVLGASMAGLLAARVLSDEFDQVTVVERDTLPSEPVPRRGVPQARHVHSLLPRGREVLEELFPGIGDQLLADGATRLESLNDYHLQFHGHLLARTPYRLNPILQSSRPLLELRVRERVAALPRVRIREHTTVVGPRVSADRTRVTGVCVTDTTHGGDPEVIAADLVVDCTGRAGHGQVWLCQLGYDQADEEEVKVGISYLSAQLRLPEGARVAPLTLIGVSPGVPVGMALFRCEDGTWTLSVHVQSKDVPPAELPAMLRHIERVTPPEVMAALVAAEVVVEPVVFRFPASRRRHYQRLPRLPEGYLPLGDALCSFNPVYGQGMTVAALQSLALRDALRGGDHRLAARYLRAASRPVGVAWDLAVGSDLALPETPGERTRRVRMVNAWVARVLAAAETDEEVAAQFLRVIGMVDPPTALFRPLVLRRVLGRRRTAPGALAREHVPAGAGG